jgi:hypothetical protein
LFGCSKHVHQSPSILSMFTKVHQSPSSDLLYLLSLLFLGGSKTLYIKKKKVSHNNRLLHSLDMETNQTTYVSTIINGWVLVTKAKIESSSLESRQLVGSKPSRCTLSQVRSSKSRKCLEVCSWEGKF